MRRSGKQKATRRNIFKKRRGEKPSGEISQPPKSPPSLLYYGRPMGARGPRGPSDDCGTVSKRQTDPLYNVKCEFFPCLAMFCRDFP